MNSSRAVRGPERALLLILFFLSGTAALIYEVLWLKELGLLFGNTAYAAATTLAVFFLGMAVGGWVFGRRAEGLARPLRTYAYLEIGIALSALLYFLITPLFGSIYAALYDVIGQWLAVTTLIKFVLALGILFLPAFFMGGTLPVMGQHLIRRSTELGRTGSLLYFVNTIGAATGALLAGFFLPPVLGFTRSYLIAILLNVLVGAVAWRLSTPALSAATAATLDGGDLPVEAKVSDESTGERPDRLTASPRAIRIVAFMSGFLVLGLEVLWTRMFAQALHNSVYSFAAILVMFLFALALGSSLANLLCRIPNARPGRILAVLSGVGCLLAAISPVLFFHLTNGLDDVSGSGWSAYLLRIFGLAAAVMLAPGIVVGAIYPYLLKVSEWVNRAPGHTIGHLAAVNSVGGILGSLLAGFALLALAGLWGGVLFLAAGYLAVAAVALGGRPGWVALRAVVAVAAAFALFSAVMPDLPVVRIPEGKNWKILEQWDGRHGIVAAISEGRDRWIQVDNHYVLGGADAADSERRQTQIPMFMQPGAESVFFLGMGTGITAGAALDFPVRRVVTCELIPEVVTAAQRHFKPYTNGLFTDPRSTVVVDDGRHYLMGTRETFDVIISDLFIPWQAGTGSLYTREHFEIVRSRLHPDGLFAQWVPASQMSRAEFNILARTILEVFPQVTVWRGEFIPEGPTLGFLCRTREQVMDPRAVRRNLGNVIPERGVKRITDSDLVPYIHYAGNLAAVRHLFAEAPVNTDDRPLVEYMAPKTQQHALGDQVSWLNSYELLDLFEEFFREVPTRSDPYLAEVSEQQHAFIRAGLQLHAVSTHVQAGRAAEAAPIYREFLSVVPLDMYPGLADLGAPSRN